MENRKFKVNLGRTINMGDFESFRVDVGLEADFDDRISHNDAYAELFAEVNKQLLVITETVKGKKEESRYRGRGR